MLRQRVLTGVIAGAVVLLAMFASSSWPLLVIIVAAGIVGILELRGMAQVGGHPYSAAETAVAAAVAAAAAALVWGLQDDAARLAGTAALGLAGAAVVAIGRWARRPVPFLSAGVLWLAAPLALAVLVHSLTSHSSAPFGPNLVPLILIPVWVGDCLAYFVGKAWGRRKLAPKISPNKTWEGAGANLLGCVAAAVGIGYALGVPLVASLAVGLSAGVVGQLGDLLKSALKRAVGVKDSGRILPGHGGIVDRMDSFILSAGTSVLLLLWLAPAAFEAGKR